MMQLKVFLKNFERTDLFIYLFVCLFCLFVYSTSVFGDLFIDPQLDFPPTLRSPRNAGRSGRAQSGAQAHQVRIPVGQNPAHFGGTVKGSSRIKTQDHQNGREQNTNK
jgi:hypothetical protein